MTNVELIKELQKSVDKKVTNENIEYAKDYVQR